MPIVHPNDIIRRVCAGYEARWPIDDHGVANRLAVHTTTPYTAIQRAGHIKSVPASLPSGVTAYMPCKTWIHSTNAAPIILGRLVNLGSLDISGASGTFTDGDAMPTVTELGASNQVYGPVIVEVETALNATPGSFQVTYTDHEGNTGQLSTSVGLTASAPIGSAGFLPTLGGDLGVTDITAAVRTAGTTPTGVLRFWGIMDAILWSASSSVPAMGQDFINDGIIYKYPANTELGAFMLISLTGGRCVGSIQFVGDEA